MMQVLSVASEAFPLAKTGGLGDVVGALPGALADMMSPSPPCFPAIPPCAPPSALPRLVHHYDDLMGAQAQILSGWLNGHPLLVLDAPALFDREAVFTAIRSGMDWPDNWRRFAALARAGADLASGTVPNWDFDLLHAHDWQAGLAPAYLRLRRARATPRPAS